MKKRKNSLTAKQNEKIGKRIHIEESQETKKLLLDDTFHNIKVALDKDGSTGKLGTPDGILKGKVQHYKGFMIQCFGSTRYENDLDVFGKWYWFGWAKLKTKIKGKKVTLEFDTESVMPLGFNTERECGGHLFKMVDLYRQQNIN